MSTTPSSEVIACIREDIVDNGMSIVEVAEAYKDYTAVEDVPELKAILDRIDAAATELMTFLGID